MTIPTERVRELREILSPPSMYSLNPGWFPPLVAIIDELLTRRDAEAREGWQPIGARSPPPPVPNVTGEK